MKAYALTYHVHHVRGPDYSVNEHVALALDLALLRELRIPVASLHELVDTLIHSGWPTRQFFST